MTIITSWGAGLSSHRFWREAHLTDGKTEDCCSGFQEDNWSTYSQGSLVGYHLWGRTELDTTEAT